MTAGDQEMKKTRRGIARAGWVTLFLWETRILFAIAIKLRNGDYISEDETFMLG